MSKLQGIKIIGLMCLLTHSTGFALNTYNPWYVSGSLGIFQGSYNVKYIDQTDVIPQNIAETIQQNGYTGGIAVGYSQPFSNHYVAGIELAANHFTNQAMYASGASTAAFNNKLSINNSIDLMLVPGLFLTENSLIYGKLGWSLAQIENRMNSPTGFTPTFTQINQTKGVFGPVLGIGIMQFLSTNWAVFAEFIYRNYGVVDFPNFDNFTATYTNSASMTGQSVMAGVSYSFSGITQRTT